MLKDKFIDLNIVLTKLKQELQLNPYNHEIYTKIAKVYYRSKQIGSAIYYYKRALSINPDNWEIHLNLANSYVQNNALEDAISHYKYCLNLNPECIDASQNLGMLLIENKNFSEALIYLEQTFEQKPEMQQHFEFIEQLANCYLELGKIELAIKYLSKAIELDPTKGSAAHNLAVLYLKEQNQVMANKYFNMALDLNPNNQTAKHMVNALSTITTTQPPKEYVADLFNQYADYYEQHVTEQLNYHLPAIFRNLYAKHAKITTAKNTLDLGCGTGLCGLYFRDASVNLIGIDLARKMLLKAKQHQFYDLLIESDLQTNSIFKENYFDLIIAADLLPYFGDLEKLFYFIKQILLKEHNNFSISHKSMFIFNIELSKNNGSENFVLQPSGRYVHTIEYIQKLASEFKFTIVENINENIRTQMGQPVAGTIFLLV